MALTRWLIALLFVLSPALALGSASYANNGGENEGSGTSVALTVPSGIVNGNLLIAQLQGINQTGSMPAQTGWTLAVDVTGTSSHLGIYYRYASSEPAS